MLRVAMLVMRVGVGLVARPATAVVGDLNADGKVDLQDFFILADNFGREGAPEVARTRTHQATMAARDQYWTRLATRPPSLWPPSTFASSRLAAATTPSFR